MDKVKDCLAVACLAYGRGETETAIRAFLQGMEACGQEGLEQVVQFLRPPVAAINSDVPAAENTLAPSLHSKEQNTPAKTDGVNALDIAKPVDPQPVIAPIPEPVPSTITSLSSMLLDDGDEEFEVRAEAEDDIDEDEEELDDEDESEEDEDEEEGFQLSISSATPVRLKQRQK